jgi:hypothetical protein
LTQGYLVSNHVNTDWFWLAGLTIYNKPIHALHPVESSAPLVGHNFSSSLDVKYDLNKPVVVIQHASHETTPGLAWLEIHTVLQRDAEIL